MMRTTDMTSKVAEPQTGAPDQTASQLRKYIGRLSWLSEPAQLRAISGKVFGRKIQDAVKDLTRHEGVRLLTVRQQDAAVVMSLDHYKDIVDMKAQYANLLERLIRIEIAEEADEFEQLYQRITRSRQGADALFSASDADINSAYRPGETEAP